MAISRSQMNRQLRMGGGIMNAMPRQQYGLGSFVKKAVKGVTGAVKGVAKTVKKNPMLALAALNFAPSLVAGGSSTFFGGANAMFNPTLPAFLKGTPGTKEVGDSFLKKNAGIIGVSLLGGVLGSLTPQEQEDLSVNRNVGALETKLRQAYENQRLFENDPQGLEKQISSDLSEYTQDSYRARAAYGGRMGYALGDSVNTDKIVEDFKNNSRIYKMLEGITSLGKMGVDNIDNIINTIITSNPLLAAPDILLKVLVERYGVDPKIAQRKIINRMSDSNEGFGPQGSEGTPDDGYRENIGIDSGAEDYYDVTNNKNRSDRFDDKAGIDLNDPDIRRQIPELENRAIPMPGNINEGDGRGTAIPFPDLIGEGDGRTMEERYPGARYFNDPGIFMDRGPDTDPNMFIEKGPDRDPNMFLEPVAEMANGGRIGFAGGTNEDFQKYLEGREKFDKQQNYEQLYKEFLENKRRQEVAEQKTMAANGGRIGYAFGNDNPETNAMQAAGIEGLPLNQNPAGVTELDLRETGGFIPPVGVKEKADDIPAMLANNEFVFTADAVRGMGDGNVNKGAQRMYDMMKKLEKGGRV